MRPSSERFMMRRMMMVTLALVAAVMVATTGVRAASPPSAEIGPAPVAPTPPAEAEGEKNVFRTPKGAAVAFLAAAKAKDPKLLREATALDAAKRADSKNRALFAAILNGSPSRDDLTQLASKFEGYEVVGHGNPGATGRMVIYVGKPGTDDTYVLRKVHTHMEKWGPQEPNHIEKPGTKELHYIWKIYDFSDLRVYKKVRLQREAREFRR